MKKTFLSLFVTAVLAFGAGTATTYKVKLLQKSVVNGTELSEGDYKVKVEGDRATLWRGSDSVGGDAKVESAEQKYNSTSFLYGPNSTLKEIHLGGTNTKLVFQSGPEAGAAGSK